MHPHTNPPPLRFTRNYNHIPISAFLSLITGGFCPVSASVAAAMEMNKYKYTDEKNMKETDWRCGRVKGQDRQTELKIDCQTGGFMQHSLEIPLLPLGTPRNVAAYTLLFCLSFWQWYEQVITRSPNIYFQEDWNRTKEVFQINAIGWFRAIRFVSNFNRCAQENTHSMKFITLLTRKCHTPKVWLINANYLHLWLLCILKTRNEMLQCSYFNF